MNEKRKILFYGDSNTYGYDPDNWTEFRYPEKTRWTTVLKEKLGDAWQVTEAGMNGRRLPDLRHDSAYVNSLLEQLSDQDIFAIMLGTNDILSSLEPDAIEAIDRMEQFLQFLKTRMASSKILVIAPPPCGNSMIKDPLYQKFFRQSRCMNQGFRKLADIYGTMFIDADTWDIPLCTDFVHFSAKGHRIFAENMYRFLKGTKS